MLGSRTAKMPLRQTATANGMPFAVAVTALFFRCRCRLPYGIKMGAVAVKNAVRSKRHWDQVKIRPSSSHFDLLAELSLNKKVPWRLSVTAGDAPFVAKSSWHRNSTAKRRPEVEVDRFLVISPSPPSPEPRVHIKTYTLDFGS